MKRSPDTPMDSDVEANNQFGESMAINPVSGGNRPTTPAVGGNTDLVSKVNKLVGQVAHGKALLALFWTWGASSGGQQSPNIEFQNNYNLEKADYLKNGDFRFVNEVKRALVGKLDHEVRIKFESVMTDLDNKVISFEQARLNVWKIAVPLLNKAGELAVQSLEFFQSSDMKRQAHVLLTVVKVPPEKALLAFFWTLKGPTRDGSENSDLMDFEGRFDIGVFKFGNLGGNGYPQDFRIVNEVRQALIDSMDEPAQILMAPVMKQLLEENIDLNQEQKKVWSKVIPLLAERRALPASTVHQISGDDALKKTTVDLLSEYAAQDMVALLGKGSSIRALHWLWSEKTNDIPELNDPLGPFKIAFMDKNKALEKPVGKGFEIAVMRKLTSDLADYPPIQRQLEQLLLQLENGTASHYAAQDLSINLLYPILLDRDDVEERIFDDPPSTTDDNLMEERDFPPEPVTTTTTTNSTTTTTTTTATMVAPSNLV